MQYDLFKMIDDIHIKQYEDVVEEITSPFETTTIEYKHVVKGDKVVVVYGGINQYGTIFSVYNNSETVNVKFEGKVAPFHISVVKKVVNTILI